MEVGNLTPLQVHVLKLLASVRPAWTLTGGAALVGWYTRHRTTRDLDLFWPGEHVLGALPREVESRLRADGLTTEAIQHTASFERLRVSRGDAVVIVDLVADPTPAAEAPALLSVDGVEVRVDTPHQLLVNKLCALLSRSELRDLVDLRALLDAHGDLDRALADAPRKDGGFSPLTLAWVLRSLPIRVLAARLGTPTEEAIALEAFRDEFVERLTAAAAPE